MLGEGLEGDWSLEEDKDGGDVEYFKMLWMGEG